MPDRVASIRATLKTNAFVGGLNEISKKAAETGRSIGASLESGIKRGFKAIGKASSEGFKSAKQAMGGLTGELKNGLKMAATLGGALSVGKFVTDAVLLENTYRNIAVNVGKATGEAVSWQSIQKTIDATALKTGQSAGDLAQSFTSIFKETGNLEATKRAIEAIGTSATAGQGSVEALTGVVPLLVEKFGIAGKDIPEALTRIIEKTGVGGTNLEDIGTKFELMAGDAVEAGLTGADGISKLLDVTAMLDDRLGAKAPAALKIFLEKLRDGGSAVKEFRKATGISLKGVEGFDKLNKMLTGKGRAQAELMFTGDTRTLFDELVKPFDEAVAKAKAAGAKPKEALAAGEKAFSEVMGRLGKSSMKYADLQEQAATRLKEDPKVILQRALEEAAQAFRDPAMMEAIRGLAKDLPVITKGFAQLAHWVVAHPWLAGGALVGAKVGGAFASSALGSLGGTAAKSLGGAAVGGGKNVIASTGLTPTIGTAIGSAMAVAGAAIIGYQIGEALAPAVTSALSGQDFANHIKGGQTAAIATAASASGDVASKQAALAAAKEQLARMKSEGPSLYSRALGGIASIVTGGEVKGAGDQRSEDIARQQKAIAELEASLAKTSDAGNKGAADIKTFTIAALDAAKAMRSISQAAGGGSGGEKGTKGAGNQPGAAPVPG